MLCWRRSTSLRRWLCYHTESLEPRNWGRFPMKLSISLKTFKEIFNSWRLEGLLTEAPIQTPIKQFSFGQLLSLQLPLQYVTCVCPLIVAMFWHKPLGKQISLGTGPVSDVLFRAQQLDICPCRESHAMKTGFVWRA
jgi:hypothetical protein